MSRRNSGFDTGPLAWVKGEIDLALRRGADALAAFERNPADAMQIRLSGASLHQAHGAINIVGLDGLTRVSESLEALLGLLDTDPGRRSPESFALASRAFADITAYIDDLSKGGANRPLRLLPLYEELGTAIGRAADPVDLYFVDLTRKPPAREPGSTATAGEDMRIVARGARSRYQRGFLHWLKGDAAGAEEMRAAVADVELAQGVSAQRPFWWSALGFLEALAMRSVPPALDARRLVTRIEQQLKSLSEGSPSISERLMREVLFFVAHAGHAEGITGQVKKAYALADTLPVSSQAATADAAEPPVDPAQARGRLDETKEAWNRCASGEAPDLSAFCGHLLALRESVTALRHPELALLVSRIAAAGDWIASDVSRMSDAAALEIAAGLLLVEDALAGFDALGEEFQEQSAFIRERLDVLIEGRLLRTPPESAALEDLAQRAQDQLLVSQVAGEMKTNLADIEKILDAYFRDPSRDAELAAVERPMHQLVGAFDILGEDRAKDAVKTCLALIRRFASPGYSPSGDEFGILAQTLSGIGFYVEGLINGDADFDAAMRPVEAPVIEGFEAEPLPPVAVPAVAAEPAQSGGEETVATPLSPPEPVAAPPVAELAGEAVDPELLPIYLEEAKEVLAAIRVGADVMRTGDADRATLGEVRRGFHTLKGSGRMVGLNRLGEAAWSVEQTLNLWLAEERPVNPSLIVLVDAAASYFAGSVVALESGGMAGDDAGVVALAARVRSGESVTAEPVSPEDAGESMTVSPTDTAAPPDEPQGAAPTVQETAGVEASSADEVTASAMTPVPDLVAPVVAGISAAVISDFSAPVPVDIASAAANEAVVDTAGTGADSVVRLGENEISATLFTLFSGEARMHVHAMREESEILRDHGIITDNLLRAVHTLGGICGTVKLEAPRDLAHALEHALEQLMISALSEQEQNLVNESVDALAGMVDAGLELSVPEEIPGLIDRLEEVAAFVPVPEGLVPDNSALVPEDEGALHGMLAADPSPAAATPAGVAAPAAGALDRPAAEPLPVAEVEDGPVERRRRRIRDELDPELLPVFLEEAAELVPSIGSTLRAWREEPGKATVGRELQRLLHTIKGSARMAGAMGLGELTHYMETRAERALSQTAVPKPVLDELDVSFDRMVQLHERLLHHGSSELPPPADAPPGSAAEATTPAEAARGAMPREAGQERVAMLRVRAEVVDNLVNQAGEVSIARSRLEGELRSLTGALAELTGNIARLRAQLREIEIQAEAQMQSQREELNRADGHFDPLEFDRFTRVQELTRFMAESVNDVQTVHQNLVRNTDSMEGALAAQARLNRDLQQDLMRVRMVPLAGLAERLHRIVRQTAKESGKRANLDIHGANVELDRSVLERITAPFEHLLRNAVIHGIETPAERQAQGKPATGEIRLDLSQEGNEVALVLADDGRGIDVARIREKALAAGLITPDAALTDADLADLIFVPGFSTASTVTENAGRGVGMDVVRTEVASLGGRIAISFERGRGSRFSIYLPLTLAVTQAVLARVADKIYAIPTVMVEQVQQLRADALEAARSSGEVSLQGRRYPFRDLAKLLELKPAGERRSAPVLFLRSGANALSLSVEEMVSPSEEVVVKSIGPQLARVPGVAGATVLGSGEIVLIINPVSLAQREAQAPAEAVGSALASAPAEPAPAAPAQSLVMVVDDSLTVRKVSSRLLERAGYRVVTARDGVEALELLADVMPDAMLVDIEMPRMDGFDLTRNIRGDARLAKIPIVMITSRTADKHQDFAREIGVDAYLGKPYQEDELLARLGEFIGRR